MTSLGVTVVAFEWLRDVESEVHGCALTSVLLYAYAMQSADHIKA